MATGRASTTAGEVSVAGCSIWTATKMDPATAAAAPAALVRPWW